jgi:hypothetical protein
MKTIKLVFPVLVLSILCFLITSCDNNLLKTQPTNRIASAGVWKDSTLVQAFVNDAYLGTAQIAHNNDSHGIGFGIGFQYAFMSSMTDESIYNNDNGTWQIVRGEMTPTNMGELVGLWGSAYRGVRACNTFLQHVDGVKMSELHKKRLTAQIRFIRAFRYFILLENFGGVPLIGNRVFQIDDNYQSANIYKRATIPETVNYIVSQLDSAAAVLPVNHNSNYQAGRATKGAALALKARVLLYAASPLYTGGKDNKDKWQKAANAAKAVMDMDKYSLYPNYKKLFLTPYNNPEIIFERLYTQKTNHLPFVKTNGPNGYSGWAGNVPLQNLVSQYYMANGLPITDPNSGYDPQRPYKNRDPRLNMSILHNGSEFKGRKIETFVPGGRDSQDGSQPWNTSKTGYYMLKFMNPKLSTTDNVWSQNSSGPWIYFRYAGILLDYAEAENEANGPDQSVYNAINKILKRAGMPDLPKGLSQGEMRKRIRHEREIELAFEGDRFYDVRRWKIAMKTGNVPAYGMKITKNPDGTFTYQRKVALSGRSFKKKMYWLPIPHKEILASDNMLEQNPGY